MVTTPSPVSARDQVIVALDFPTASAALDHVDRLDGQCAWFKVGLELYLAAGASIVRTLHDRGFKIFLDLKLHDIPNTVAGAVRSVASTGASLLTLHASGGNVMLRAAAEAAAAIPDAPRLLAVTVLTSIDAAQLNAIGIASTPRDQVLRLAELAISAGVPGLVCSPKEVASIRSALGDQPLLVVPGIRPAGSDAGDQSRIATPADAIHTGASMLVIGRPITRATDPAAAFAAILAEVQAAHD